jgi:hypothetical protein
MVSLRQPSPRQPPLRWLELWPRTRHGVVTLAALALLALSTAGGPGWADGVHGGQETFNVPLRCQVNGGAWRDCQMVVEQVGALWQLVLGAERYGFAHDGRGLVRMRRGEGAWMTVEARWTADAALCWDGLCARGDIPLD